MTGSADGISSRVMSCRGVAPSERSISASSGSVERMPTMVAMAIGKKTISAQIRTRASRPPPNQMSSSGASARIGTACAATIYGDSTRSMSMLFPSATPVAIAASAPTAKPSTISTRVTAVWVHSTPLAMARSPRSATSSGGGRM